jgi:hypothetical protein
MQRYEIFWGKRESLTIIIKTDIGVWNIIRIFASIFSKEYRKSYEEIPFFCQQTNPESPEDRTDPHDCDAGYDVHCRLSLNEGRDHRPLFRDERCGFGEDKYGNQEHRDRSEERGRQSWSER